MHSSMLHRGAWSGSLINTKYSMANTGLAATLILPVLLGHQQKPVFNHTSRMVYLRLNVLVSRRAAENAELASRFALAVGLAEC